MAGFVAVPVVPLSVLFLQEKNNVIEIIAAAERYLFMSKICAEKILKIVLTGI
jgi:hypothetical protein